MKNGKKMLSRKVFIKVILLSFIALFTWLIYKMIKISEEEKNGKKIKLPIPEEGISFEEQVIINRDKNKILVFSSSCPHLGCKISRYVNNKFICPCHGSEFDSEGNRVKGPATASLKKLKFYISGKDIIIENQ